MQITVLAENTATDERFGKEHGLSLYIQTQGQKILIDMGQTELFLENARKLNIDLKKRMLQFSPMDTTTMAAACLRLWK